MTTNAEPRTFPSIRLASMSKPEQSQEDVEVIFDGGERKFLPYAAAYDAQMRKSLGYVPVAELMPPTRINAEVPDVQVQETPNKQAKQTKASHNAD